MAVLRRDHLVAQNEVDDLEILRLDGKVYLVSVSLTLDRHVELVRVGFEQVLGALSRFILERKAKGRRVVLITLIDVDDRTNIALKSLKITT